VNSAIKRKIFLEAQSGTLPRPQFQDTLLIGAGMSSNPIGRNFADIFLTVSIEYQTIALCINARLSGDLPL